MKFVLLCLLFISACAGLSQQEAEKLDRKAQNIEVTK